MRAPTWLLASTFLLAASPVGAQTGANVLLVINDSSPASVQIGEYYARKRSIPQGQVVHLKAAAAETIARADYERTIESTIGTYLLKSSLQDQILYIVLTKGIPLRITGTDGRTGTVASVDSELTLLYRKMVGTPVALPGRVNNPYFLAEKALTEAKPFTRFLADTYLVTRLDGFTVDDVLKLIDRGLAPVSDGRILLDQKATVIDRGGDQWLQQAADRLQQANAGDRVVLETTRAVGLIEGPVLGYYSWGSNDPSNQLRHLGLKFAPGAVAATFVSTDGRTFAEPPAQWLPSDPNGRGPTFGGSFQSLAGDLIRDGITGVAAHVAEPYLDATIRPQILFPAYLAGFNLAESFYMAMPFLSWETIIVGDPLCTPFPRKDLAPEQLYKGPDPETDLPALFVERRLAFLSPSGTKPEALKLALKADIQFLSENPGEAEQLLQRATEIDPKFMVGHFRLASQYENRAEYDKAIDRYRRVLAVDPENVVALNDLAYALAERRHEPKEALPLAQKAYQRAQVPPIADTLGWIHHLLGDDKVAAPLLERAAAADPRNADILIHAAIVHQALGDLVKARAELAAAEKLNPQVGERPDVKALRERLK